VAEIARSEPEAVAALLMADDPNLVVHVYREAIARNLDTRLGAHAATLARWLDAMRQRTGDP
jgi:hypothetical protein